MKKIKLLVILFALAFTANAQKDWSKVNFSKEYKSKFKISGGAAKVLKKNKTFVAGYTIGQATVMKGSEKTANAAVFAEASLAGVSPEAYQKMVDDLYKELIDELTKAGLTITDGEDVINSAFAKKQLAKGDKKIIIGNTGDKPSYEGKKSVVDASIFGYTAGAGAVMRDVSFPPRNKNIYITTKKIYGNFYQNLALKEGFNLLFINFNVSFASFDGGRGYKNVKLSTKPVISIKANVQLITPKGGYSWITYEKEVWGSGDWSKGMGKTKDNKSTAGLLGLARSSEYAINADSQKYLSEVNDIISNFQKDIVKGIKAAL